MRSEIEQTMRYVEAVLSSAVQIAVIGTQGSCGGSSNTHRQVSDLFCGCHFVSFGSRWRF